MIGMDITGIMNESLITSFNRIGGTGILIDIGKDREPGAFRAIILNHNTKGRNCAVRGKPSISRGLRYSNIKGDSKISRGVRCSHAKKIDKTSNGNRRLADLKLSHRETPGFNRGSKGSRDSPRL